jgi:hypothetical protein
MVDTRWQQYSTHLHTNSTQNTQNGTYIAMKNRKWRPCPVFASYTLAFALQLKKKHGETSVRVVEKCPCPDIPVAAVQNTFTHKQYAEHSERNMHNNNHKLVSAGCVPFLHEDQCTFIIISRLDLLRMGKVAKKIVEENQDT